MKSRLAALSFAVLSAATPNFAADWPSWRGPYQNGVSAERYTDQGKLSETPAWTYDARGRGAPVVFDGKVFLWGYKGETTDLIELLTCLDAKTGKKLWEHELPDYLSDSIYNRYSIGAPSVDPETKRVYLVSNAGVFYCFEADGTKVFELPLMEDLGRMTFPNSRVGSPVIEGDLVLVHFIFSNWGADGPAADRIYGFDKKTGELVWWTLPGVSPPVDSAFSTPVLETRDGKRVAYFTTGCGHVVCVNARSGKPYWKMPICKNGVNSSVVLHGGDKLIAIHNDENIDTTEKGRMVCIKLPEKLTAPVPPATESLTLEPSAELWRFHVAATSSSPVLVGDTIYQLSDGGQLHAINALTGAELWNKKLSNANLHSSALYVDGMLYCPMMAGKLVVVKPSATDGEVVQELKLPGECLGAPVVCDGMLYITTTEKFHAFAIPNKGIKLDPIPVPEMPKAGKPAALQAIPAEVVLMSGEKKSFRVRSIDENGFVVSDKVDGVKWESFIPPTAKVKATMDASFNDAGELVTTPESKNSAGAFKATSADGLSGIIRGRVLKNLPLIEDFEAATLTEEFPADAANPAYKFAYPPLPWIGARFKFQIMEKDGNKVFGKSFDRLLFQRATVFVAPSHLSNYTMQADVLTEGSARSKSDIGLIHQRYLICMRGNAGKLEVSSNLERLKQEALFKMTANKWYTLKSRVDAEASGAGTVRAKVWEKGTAEPEAWTIEVKVPRVHKNGSPGIFGFTPLNQKRVYLDNLSVTPNP
jgi:outer membrane protein assembly factor BamB